MTGKTTKYYFHDVARSERYFTATHLAHLLMSNNFEGTKRILSRIHGIEIEEPDDFEIVTELDPIRDASVLGKAAKQMFKENGRVAVPDIFLRCGNYACIIEAKFFTLPAWEDLRNQVNEQKKAINLVISSTKYEKINLKYCLLLVDSDNLPRTDEIVILTWDEIMAELHVTGKVSEDYQYSVKIIREAIRRATKEFSKSKKGWTKINSFQKLISSLPKLLDEGKIWVGFGEKLPLDQYDLSYLEKRSEYRVSEERLSNNWIRIDELVSRYITLKYE